MLSGYRVTSKCQSVAVLQPVDLPGGQSWRIVFGRVDLLENRPSRVDQVEDWLPGGFPPEDLMAGALSANQFMHY